ncbi:MAG: ethylbenzene dehydrogenase-related protein [Candidatus Marinimicrobia bacterium]|nr:ethylbenzene dehydrogenase-related protein [Candidatus Neomarinimicrobiota bacterium]
MKNVTVLMLILSLIFVGCESNDDGETPVDFMVTSVTTPPTLDGVGGDAAWAEATTYLVKVGESEDYANAFGVVDVSLTAVKTATDLYLKAVWDDPSATESVAKNQWGYTGGAWEKTGNEDRLFFFFDMGENGSEGANCATMCHTGGVQEGMWTANGIVDQWHWKAARTAPINHADDKHINNVYEGLGDGGQHGDAKTIGLYNDNKLDDMPKYTGPLTDGFLILPADSNAADYFTPFNSSTTTGSYKGYWLNENADGSRADVTAYSNFSSGRWTVEFKRALDTGNADDVVFGSGNIEMTMAITDDSGGHHSGSAPFDMKF